MATTKKCMAIIAAVVVTCAGLVATRGASVLASTTHAAATLTIAFPYQPDTLNPAVTGQTITIQIDRNIFDTLVWQTPNGAVTPDLATKWHISNGGKTYTFILRHGVKFQDGTPFNAAAVAANLNYIVKPSTHSVSAIGALGPFKSAHAAGPYKVVVDLKSPYAPLLPNLGQPTLGIQSPTSIRKNGAAVGDHPVGTGPFEVVKWVKGSNLVLKRNPDYRWAPAAEHRNGPATLDQIVYDFVESGAARIDELQTGQAQLVDQTPALFYKTLRANPSYHAIPVPIAGAGVYAVINNAKWPTNSIAVRKAILYSVDRFGVIKLADAGVYPPTWGPLQKGTFGYDPHLNGMYKHNPGLATHLLASAGWKKAGGVWQKGGRKLSVLITAISGVEDLPLLAQAIEGYLHKAGMLTSIQEMAEPPWVADNISGKENITPLEFSDIDPDLLHLEFTPGQYFNWSKYNNPTVTKLIDRGELVANPAKRLPLYWHAEKILMDQAVLMPIRQNEDLVLTSSKVKGVGVYSGGEMNFYAASVS